MALMLSPVKGSPAARAAILDSLHSLHRYPDPLGGDLRRALAACHGLEPAQVILGNGSHELLMLMGQVFAGPGRAVVSSQYGFAVYALAAQAADGEIQRQPGRTVVQAAGDAAQAVCVQPLRQALLQLRHERVRGRQDPPGMAVQPQRVHTAGFDRAVEQPVQHLLFCGGSTICVNTNMFDVRFVVLSIS